MLADMSQLNIVMVAGAIILLLLTILWFVMRAPGRWLGMLALGIVVAAAGAGIFVYQGLRPSSDRQTAVGGGAPPGSEMAGTEALEAERRQQEQIAREKAEAERRQQELIAREKEEAGRQLADTPRRLAEESKKEGARQIRLHDEEHRLARIEIEREETQRQEAPPVPQGLRGGGLTTNADNTPSEQPKPASPLPQTRQEWQVVPVFYGTDRDRQETNERIAYTAERGNRLEVGRALVTVPKIHQVPNIERPWVYKIPFTDVVIFEEAEDPARHFTMKELKNLTQEEFAALARAQIAKSKAFRDQALVFIHGFYTTFDYAVYRAAQISYDMDFDGGSFVYSWPSRGEVSLTAYTADREASEQAENYLEQFLKLIAEQSGARSMTIIAHSMGNKLLLPVLQKLKFRNDTDIKISQIILAAPDVDKDIFANLAREIEGLSTGGVTLYAAANDRALDASQQFWGGVARAGDVPENGPIVIEGIDTIDVTALSTDMFSLNHGGYAQSKTLLQDIRSLMLQGYRLPHVRNNKIRQLPATDGGVYWKYN